jgi:hypothetical protein
MGALLRCEDGHASHKFTPPFNKTHRATIIRLRVFIRPWHSAKRETANPPEEIRRGEVAGKCNSGGIQAGGKVDSTVTFTTNTEGSSRSREPVRRRDFHFLQVREGEISLTCSVTSKCSPPKPLVSKWQQPPRGFRDELRPRIWLGTIFFHVSCKPDVSGFGFQVNTCAPTTFCVCSAVGNNNVMD